MKKYFLILLLISFGCIDPYEVDVSEGAQLLTIEGTVTNGPGPHLIKLSRSATYGSIFQSLVRPVSGAIVVIRDNTGSVAIFSEDRNMIGTYISPEGFSGVVGRSYTLLIELADGKTYTSLPEKINKPIEISKIFYKSETIPVEGQTNLDSGVGIFVELADPSDENNYYFWRNSPSVYLLQTRPDLFFNRTTMMTEPKDCCSRCFRYETTGNTSYFLTNDDSFNGLKNTIKAAFIPDDGLRFIDIYRVDLNQLSITANAYRFLRLAKQQSEITGSVFDPPPANIRGNMLSPNTPDEVVLGYFIAAGETQRRIYIFGADLEFRQPVRLIPDDCRRVDNTTSAPPVDWNAVRD